MLGYTGVSGNLALGEVAFCEVYAQQQGNSRLNKKYLHKEVLVR